VHTAKTYAAVLVLSCLTVLAQLAPAQSQPAQPAPQAAIPQLDHFDVTQVDNSLDPCVDFYQYTCKKWIAKNPIPPDQANWWLGSKLMIWNQTVVRDILEKTASDDLRRGPAEQKIGDYYASCLNESEINNKGITEIKPELDRIQALRNKTQLAAALAHIHFDHVRTGCEHRFRVRSGVVRFRIRPGP
jgi:putative endopeptidase